MKTSSLGLGFLFVIAGAWLFTGCGAAEGDAEEGAGEIGVAEQALCSGGTAISLAGAAASSSKNATNTADKAIDTSLTTRWESAWSDNQSIYVDLGAAATISSVVLNWEGACGKNYTIDVSNSASGPWTTIKTVTNNSAAGSVTLSGWTNKKGRYVRMNGQTRCLPAYGFSLYDFKVLGCTLIANGQACNDASDCSSGICSTSWLDNDHDGYGTTPRKTCGDKLPAGSANKSGDCCDSDANAHPGQTAFSPLPDACGSYDYNCDGSQQPTYSTVYSCSVAQCTSGYGEATVPACGQTGHIVVCAAPTGCGAQSVDTFGHPVECR